MAISISKPCRVPRPEATPRRWLRTDISLNRTQAQGSLSSRRYEPELRPPSQANRRMFGAGGNSLPRVARYRIVSQQH